MIFQLYLILSHMILAIMFIITISLYTQEKLNTQLSVGYDTDNYDDDNHDRNSDTYRIKIEKIRRLFYTVKLMEGSSHAITDLTKNYSFDHTQSPHKDFNNWETQERIFSEFCVFGIQELQHYVTHKTSERQLLVATDILKRIKTKVDDTISNYFSKWRSWHNGLNHLLRLLNTYEYIANDHFVKYSICHNLIIKIVPKLDQLFEIKVNDEKIMLSGIPRLLTNFLFDITAYENDIESNEFQTLNKYFYREYNLSDEVKTGLYSDGSCIKDNSVASYLDLLPLVKKRDVFYDKIYSALDFKVNYRDRMKFILGKLLHPSIKYHIVGLFGNKSNKIQIPDWWNFKLLNTGVHVFPFTGIGVFKKPNILFAIHLHQLSINPPVEDEFTLGLMQLRKIYQLKDNEGSELSKKQVFDEPGVIRIKESETDGIYECVPKESYIGKLIDTYLLFWMNKYEVTSPYKCEVTEIGVMTDNGLVSKYRITNKERNRSLIFVSTNNNGQKIDNTINAGITTTFSLKITLNDDETITNVDFESDKLMNFEYNGKRYEIISLNDKKSYIVKYENKPILGGTSSSNPFDFIHYDNQIFKRFSSFMYEPTMEHKND